MFWKATLEKPIYVEYANDVPGSAFEESKGQFHYSHRRLRKRTYYKSRLDSSDCKQTVMGCGRDTQIDDTKGASVQSDADKCLRMTKSVDTVSTFSSNDDSQPFKEKSSDTGNDMQGTAGWKLSNSPWNLQVIARSSGSLTRFMPDDIPGVTSPMVYIGMLFSWFAWHVEDHELHSMNFLHTGSSKTWYAVPGDYAFAFEEVIRTEGYGGNIDHLAALKLLGEKTTLLSPEVIVASGIPCCRLTQNPGEFVVTFPRAYHVGFSHGFNCGEAANFGTPQWLSVAKEAAVRRAAMNYLPMLSHQQLLYLLTMSFISSVPRTLLPGVRSSRLRDRQKEEREFLVKQAFIEDMVQENKLLSILLGKEAAKRAVLWKAELLPDSSKGFQLPDLTSTTGTSVANMPNISSAKKSGHYLLDDEMSLYMDSLTNIDIGGDDLPYHFETDSGALACVGCGILGFPFMAVIQPTEKLTMELPDNHLIQVSSSDSTAGLHSSISRNTFVLYYQKIKAHASEVAVEIHSAFDYNEVPLDTASPENLTLIDLAVDGEELDECEDWTSTLGINLRNWVHTRNNAPSKQVPWTLGTLFHDKCPASNILALNWQSRRFRSKRSSHLAQTKSSHSIERKKDDRLGGRINDSTADKKLIQYSRRKFKSKHTCFPVANMVCELQEKSQKVSATLSANHDSCVSKTLQAEDLRTECALPCASACTEMSSMHPEIQIAEMPISTKMIAAKSQPSNSIPDHVLMIEKLGAEIESQTMQESYVDRNNDLTLSHSKMHHNTNVSEICGKESQDCQYKKCSSTLSNAPDGNIEMIKKTEIAEAVIIDSHCNRLTLDDQGHQEYQSNYKSNNEEAAVSTASMVNQSTLASVDGNVESPNNNHISERISSPIFLEKANEEGIDSISEMDKEPRINESPISKHTPNEVCEVRRELYASVDLQSNGILDDEQQVTQGGKNSKREITHVSTEQCCPSSGQCQIESVKKINEDPVCSYAAKENINEIKADLSQYKRGLESCELATEVPRLNSENKKKRKVERTGNRSNSDNFIRSPCEGLRPRAGKFAAGKSGVEINQVDKENQVAKRARRSSEVLVLRKNKKDGVKKSHKCDLDGCRMSFKTKAELLLHKRNLCPHEGCGKKFSSHKYALLHQRVHDDERPLKCPWKGCSMSFKWAWARTEHIRVHTGEKPYHCKVEGCGLSFRFVSDFSRHRRKTGHHVKPPA
ncbi:hypothetical protein LR48_Vigan02g187100 [Vigna angularis]|uniref:JmjC domain-containing protein n=1 Tax=Phaseolus angularis TaxID=3914 RepID=A0A0L9TYY7_PHAAN|nr:hypothetical protein LR48_Vigan02g187100 [Vigna angularis]